MQQHPQNITIEYLQGLMADVILSQKEVAALFRESDKKFLETDKKFLETDKKFLETDRKFQEMREDFKETDRKFMETDRKFMETDKKFMETDRKFMETDKKFMETDRKFQETDRIIKETDRIIKESDKKYKEMTEETNRKMLESKQETDKKFRQIHEELGGIGKSNGEIAESFFSNALKNKMQIGKLKFDYIDLNVTRKKNSVEAEYDVILYNNYKVLVVEIKYNFRMDHLHRFYKSSLKKFRSLFPHYKEFKLYGAIAALTFEKDVIKEAEKYGFFVLTQSNDNLKLRNAASFEPSEIK